MFYMEIRWLAVVRDVAIIWVLTFLAGVVAGATGATGDQLLSAAALGSLIFGSVGFTISGCMARTNRWQHLLLVAIGIWLVSQLNYIYVELSLAQWLIGIISVGAMMFVGGALSYLFVRNPRKPLKNSRGSRANPDTSEKETHE